MKNGEAIVNRPELEELIKKYIKSEVSMADIACELNVTKSAVSFVFNKKIFPSPVESKKIYYQKACNETKSLIEKRNTVEEIVQKFPFMKDKEKINRLIRKGDIKTNEKVFTSEEIEKLNLIKEVVREFNLNYPVNEIAKKNEIKRGKVLSILRTEFGTKNINQARKIAYERKS